MPFDYLVAFWPKIHGNLSKVGGSWEQCPIWAKADNLSFALFHKEKVIVSKTFFFFELTINLDHLGQQ